MTTTTSESAAVTRTRSELEEKKLASLATDERDKVLELEQYFANSKYNKYMSNHYRNAQQLLLQGRPTLPAAEISSSSTTPTTTSTSTSASSPTTTTTSSSPSSSSEARLDPGIVLDVHCLLRFLRGRKGSVEAAKKAIEEWIEWRETKKPHLITVQQVKEEVETKKGYWFGFDKAGNPNAYVRPQFHVASQRDFQQCIQYTLFTAETGIALMNETGERYNIIYDGSGVGYKNVDIDMVKEFFKIQGYYPERLNNLFIVKPGWMFSTLLSLAKPFFDPVTFSKIVEISSYEELLKYVDASQLEKEFGGNAEYQFDYNTYAAYATKVHEFNK